MTAWNRANVEVRCGCEERSTWCVRVPQTVPEDVRCPPSGSGGGGGAPRRVICRKCGHTCFPSVGALERKVAQAVDGAWRKHIPQGKVIIEC